MSDELYWKVRLLVGERSVGLGDSPRTGLVIAKVKRSPKMGLKNKQTNMHPHIQTFRAV